MASSRLITIQRRGNGFDLGASVTIVLAPKRRQSISTTTDRFTTKAQNQPQVVTQMASLRRFYGV
jgi:hypothetical protein